VYTVKVALMGFMDIAVQIMVYMVQAAILVHTVVAILMGFMAMALAPLVMVYLVPATILVYTVKLILMGFMDIVVQGMGLLVRLALLMREYFLDRFMLLVGILSPATVD